LQFSFFAGQGPTISVDYGDGAARDEKTPTAAGAVVEPCLMLEKVGIAQRPDRKSMAQIDVARAMSKTAKDSQFHAET
jgi:hypothetical protein